jgi:hypothetical protein
VVIALATLHARVDDDANSSSKYCGDSLATEAFILSLEISALPSEPKSKITHAGKETPDPPKFAQLLAVTSKMFSMGPFECMELLLTMPTGSIHALECALVG